MPITRQRALQDVDGGGGVVVVPKKQAAPVAGARLQLQLHGLGQLHDLDHVQGQVHDLDHVQVPLHQQDHGLQTVTWQQSWTGTTSIVACMVCSRLSGTTRLQGTQQAGQRQLVAG